MGGRILYKSIKLIQTSRRTRVVEKLTRSAKGSTVYMDESYSHACDVGTRLLYSIASCQLKAYNVVNITKRAVISYATLHAPLNHSPSAQNTCIHRKNK
jgi:hypothetical protein